MKKILFLLAMVSVVSGCSPVIEKLAIERCREYIYEMVNSKAKKKGMRIEKLSVENINIVYSNDSVCVIECDASVKAFTDEDVSTAKFEYVIYKDFFQSEIEGKSIYYEFGNGEREIYDVYKRIEAEYGTNMSFYKYLMDSYKLEKFTIVPDVE